MNNALLETVNKVFGRHEHCDVFVLFMDNFSIVFTLFMVTLISYILLMDVI
jgi:hypothetical protein